MNLGCLPSVTEIFPQTGVEEGEQLLWYLYSYASYFLTLKTTHSKRPKKEGRLSSWEDVQAEYLSCQDLC